jgi:hypothetical protein
MPIFLLRDKVMQDSSSAGAARSHSYEVPRASSADIMREQMEYLLRHEERSCSPSCPECARLEQVKRCLFLPFR